jgi:hypothetical protein
MAKIHTETLVITISKLVKDNGDVDLIATEGIVAALAEVTEQLVGAGVVVEVEIA